MYLKIERVSPPRGEPLPLPTRATEWASGLDLRADKDVRLPDGVPVVVPTGIRIEVPRHFEAQVRSRSGLACKGVSVANAPGTIDADYRGEVGVILVYRAPPGAPPEYGIQRGERIAQLVVAPVEMLDGVEVGARCPHAGLMWHREPRRCVLCDGSGTVPSLGDTARGDGGFGSTGVK